MRTSLRGNKLHIYAQQTVSFAHAAFDCITYAEFFADAFDVDVLPLYLNAELRAVTRSRT